VVTEDTGLAGDGGEVLVGENGFVGSVGVVRLGQDDGGRAGGLAHHICDLDEALSALGGGGDTAGGNRDDERHEEAVVREQGQTYGHDRGCSREYSD